MATEYPAVNGRGGIRWCYPVLPLAKYSVQPGCGYLDPGYYSATGSVHCGTDFNGVGGGNTDLGDSIHAAADGVVTEATQHRVWGWVIVIRHTGVGGGYGTVETQYAHAEKSADVLVKVGDRVKCGQVIMRMGRGGYNQKKGGYYFLSHLHFEVRTTLGLPGDEWPSIGRSRASAEAYTKATRNNPVKFLQFMMAAKTADELNAPVPRPTTQIVVTPQSEPVKVQQPALFDLARIELLDQSGKFVPMPGGDVIYKGLRITRVGSKVQIKPKETN